MPADVVTQTLDGLPVRLRRPHDLRFLARWGRVFRVLDQQDSGNLCFGVDGPDGRVFVKYAGAETERHAGTIGDAVDSLRRSEEVFRDLAHPTLVRLREAVVVGAGFALVFDWTDAVPLGRQYDRRAELESLTVAQRADAVQQIIEFSAHAAARGWVAVDLYDGSVMVDPATGRVTLCDLDVYERAPLRNTMGRMWGSDRFMAPEEYELGAVIDEVTTVFTLGSLAHSFLGDDSTQAGAAWTGSPEQLAVSRRATRPERGGRWSSIGELADAWAAASPSA
jgi:serine/threonine protein kinase, bacterial